MRIDEYLEATGQSQNAFSAAAGVSQSTIQRIAVRGGACRIDLAARLVKASRLMPAISRKNGRPLADGHITFEDLAAGAAEYHKTLPPVKQRQNKARTYENVLAERRSA